MPKPRSRQPIAPVSKPDSSSHTPLTRLRAVASDKLSLLAAIEDTAVRTAEAAWPALAQEIGRLLEGQAEGSHLLRALAAAPDPVVRRFSVAILEAWHGAAELPLQLLRWLATDRDHTVAKAAAQAFGARVKPKTDLWDELKELLNSASPQARTVAAWACTRINYEQVLNRLNQLAADGDPQVREVAAQAWQQAISNFPDQAWTKLQELAKTPATEAAAGWQARHTATLTLRLLAPALGPEVLPLLTPLLEDAQPDVRAAAVYALGELAADLPDRIVPLLLPLANGEKNPADHEAQLAAIACLPRLLARGPLDRVLQTLERLTKNSHQPVAAAAARACGQLAHAFPERMQAVLTAALQPSDDFAVWLRRQALARGLTEAAPPFSARALPFLTWFHKESIPELREAMTQALARVAAELPDEVMKFLSELAQTEREESNWELRRMAAQTLQEIVRVRPEHALPLLERMAGDQHGNVRAMVAQALQQAARLFPEQTFPVLLRLADSKTVERRRCAAQGLIGLTSHANERVIAVLSRLLQDKDSDVRAAVAGALGQLAHVVPEQAVPLLQRLLRARREGSDWQARLTAAQWLGTPPGLFSPQVIPLLETLAADKDEDVQLAATRAWQRLARWVPEQALALAEGWDVAQQPRLRAARLNILCAAVFCGHAPALAQLRQQQQDQDEEQRADAARVWAELRFVVEKEAWFGLNKAAEDPDWVVREAATLALGARGWLKPKTITKAINRLTGDEEFAVVFAASAVEDELRLTAERNNAGAAAKYATNPLRPLERPRLAHYRQSELGTHLLALITSATESGQQREGLRVRHLPGDARFLQAITERLLDAPDLTAQWQQAPGAAPALPERAQLSWRKQLSEGLQKILNKLPHAKTDFTFLMPRSREKEPSPVEFQAPAPMADRREFRARWQTLLEHYDRNDPGSLTDMERLAQLQPRPLLFYAIYRGAPSLAARRVARLGYDLASLVEQIETADLRKDLTQAQLRGRLQSALGQLIQRCARLEREEAELYGERFTWLKEALTITALEDIPLLLARPIQQLTALRRGEEWLERSREALRQAAQPLRDLDAHTSAELKTFLLLSGTLRLEAAARRVSAETWEPYRSILLQAVTVWRELLGEESQRSQRGADLEINIPSRVPAGEQVELTVEVRNLGPSPVSNLRVEVRGEFFLIAAELPLRLPALAVGQAHSFSVLGRVREPRFKVTCLVHYDEPRRSNQARQHSIEVLSEGLTPPARWQNIRNPFVAGTPLNPELHDRLFVGRDGVFEFLREQLVNAITPRPVVLYGRRRMGKTSILQYLHRELPEHYHVINIDLQRMALLHTGAQHLHYITGLIARKLPAGTTITQLDLKEYEANPADQFERVFLPELRQALDGRRLVLAFDEFQALEDKIRRGDLEAGFPEFLRYWLSRGEHCFVFAGTRTFEDLDREVWEILFNQTISQSVGLLSKDDSQRIMTEPLLEADVSYDQPALDRLDELTGRHPYFIQRLCSEVVDELNRRQQRLINLATVEAAAQHLINTAAMQLRFLWDELDPKQRAVIAALREATELQADPTTCRAEEVWTWMAQSSQVPHDDFQSQIRGLEKGGLIVNNDGALSFSLGLLRDYLAQHVPTRETRERILLLWGPSIKAPINTSATATL